MTRQFFRDVLEKLLGHSVVLAQRIDEAIALAQEARLDIIFLDRNLPDGTALEFCQTLAQLPGPQVPKWLVTGEKPLEWNAALWAQFDVRGYLVKPFRIEAISRILEEHLKPSPTSKPSQSA